MRSGRIVAVEGASRARLEYVVEVPQQRAEPVLITDAELSYEESLAVRKHRYKIMMGMRIPLMILAAFFYTIPWLAVTLLVLSIPLPWVAVLIANDRLPKKVENAHRYRRNAGELELERRDERERENRIIDG